MHKPELTPVLDAPAILARTEDAGDAAWIRALRAEGARAAGAFAAPDRALHLWRYTDPERLELDADFQVETVSPEFDSKRVPDGVLVTDLRTAAHKHRALIEPWLAKQVEAGRSRQAALNLALQRGGAFIFVPRGIAVSETLRMVSQIGAADGVAAFPRLLVVLEAGAELSLVDEQVAADRDARAHVNAVTELVVGDGATLRYALVQNLGSRVTHSLTMNSRLGRDANLDTITVSVGAKLSKVDVGTTLAGRGASCRMLGIVFGDGRQHFDHHTVLDHVAEHTTSVLDFRVALAGRADSAYTGVLRIRETATRTDARQENRNLLLSDGAHAESIPELEISTDDVSAAHAVAVGPIEESQVFYCQSRGLDREHAIQAIVRGFFEPIVARVPSQAVREAIRHHVDTKLGVADPDIFLWAEESE